MGTNAKHATCKLTNGLCTALGWQAFAKIPAGDTIGSQPAPGLS